MSSGSWQPGAASDGDLEPVGVAGQQPSPTDRSYVSGRRWIAIGAVAVVVIGVLVWNGLVTRSQLDDVRARLKQLEASVPRPLRICFPSPVDGSIAFDVARHEVTGSIRGLRASSYVEVRLDGRQSISGRSDRAGVVDVDAPWFVPTTPALAALFIGTKHSDAKLFVRGGIGTCRRR